MKFISVQIQIDYFICIVKVKDVNAIYDVAGK